MPRQPINKFIVTRTIKQEHANRTFLQAGDAATISGLTAAHSGSYSQPTVQGGGTCTRNVQVMIQFSHPPSTAKQDKVKFTLSKQWKLTGGVHEYLHLFSTSALDGSKWLTWSPGRLMPGTEIGTHWIEDRVGPRDGLDPWWRKKSFVTTGIRNPDGPVSSLITILYRWSWGHQ
jgi:hypothetical protein